MKIGEVAEQLGTTTRTLRFYEEQGLIAPRRSERGTRQYSGEDVRRFEAILTLARLGVPLDTIRELASVRPESRTGDEASHRVDELLAALQGELASQRRALARAERDLERARVLVERCFGCRNRPTREGCVTCPVTRELGSARVMQLIWDQAE